MADERQVRRFDNLWIVGLTVLVGLGGYNFISGTREDPASLPAPASPASQADWDAGAQHAAMETDLELATFMGHLQHHAHKLNLSLLAQNPELSRFYLHEAEEVLEQVVLLFPTHDDFPVAAMVRSFAQPPLRAVSQAVDYENWSVANRRFADFVTACNDCHQATAHAFIKIVVSETNPFNQSFER